LHPPVSLAKQELAHRGATPNDRHQQRCLAAAARPVSVQERWVGGAGARVVTLRSDTAQSKNLEGNVTFQNSCVRPYRFELYRKTRRPAEAARLGVLSFILLAAVVPLHAQQGLPIVQQPGGGTGPSPIVVDASQYWTAGGDACKAIQNAIGQMQTVKNGVVDARAITGDVPCAVNMFGTSNPTGKLLLGNVTIHAQVPQVQPSKFQVEGVGWSPDVSANTRIVACVMGDSNCNNQVLSPKILWCWGAGGACSSSTNNGISFGALTQHITFDCAGLSGCTDMQAYWVQEGTGCWHCQFWGWYNAGIGLDVCDGVNSPGKGSCQNSSFLDIFASLSATVTCTTTAIPIRVNSGGSIGPKFIKQVTVDASKCSVNLPNQTPYDSFRFSSQDTTLEQVLVGQGTVVGLRVGGDSAVTNVTINNVQAGSVSTDSTGTQCLSQTGATTVLLDSANAISNATLLSIGALGPGNPPGNPSSTPPTNIIVDCANSNVIPRTLPDLSVAQYTLGPVGKFTFGTSSSERAQVSLLNQNSSISSTTLFTPTSAAGTYVLALCLWIQTTAHLPAASVTASVSSSNGTVTISDSTAAVSFASPPLHSCVVTSEHIVSGTPVTYSTAIGSGAVGTYGLDIVETQVQ